MMNEVLIFVEEFFAALDQNDKDRISDSWFVSGNLMINNEKKQLDFLSSLPDFIGFKVLSMDMLNQVDDVYMVTVQWQMVMPGSTGSHESMIAVAELDHVLKIMSMIDYGTEENGGKSS